MKILIPCMAWLVLVVAVPAAVGQEAPAAVERAEPGAAEVVQPPREPLSPEDRANVAAFVAVGVAFITGVSIIGAAYAVAHVGSAAIGAASEKPEMMGRSLIFVALGEGLAVLGLAVAFVMLFTTMKDLL